MDKPDDAKTLHGMGYAQQLSRGLGVFSNFSISFSIICIVAGGITSYPLALAAGGGFSATVGWVVGGLFALIVAVSLAQIASAFPTAGALYHWSSILGGRGWGWATAWINLIGLIFVLASVDVGAYLLFEQLVAGPVLKLNTTSWAFGHQTIIVSGMMLTQIIFNHYGIHVTRMLTDFSGVLVLGLSVSLVTVFLTFGHPIEFARLIHFTNNTGSPSGGYIPHPRPLIVAFLIGLLYPIYTLTGFDASAHTAEETIAAQKTVPRGMVYSVLYALAFGFVLACSFVLATPDLQASAHQGADSWSIMYTNLPAPVALKSILAVAIVAANYLCGLATITSTSRMVFAFSRDGGLPGSNFLKRVSKKYRTPVPAIWLTGLLGISATLYSPAFAALAAGSALFLYVSYAMPVAAGLLAEGKRWKEFGPFRLGIWSKPCAIVVLVGVLVLAYAGVQPPNNIVINYGLALIFLLAVYWFAYERRRFTGPPVGQEIVARAASIARIEADLKSKS